MGHSKYTIILILDNRTTTQVKTFILKVVQSAYIFFSKDLDSVSGDTPQYSSSVVQHVFFGSGGFIHASCTHKLPQAHTCTHIHFLKGSLYEIPTEINLRYVLLKTKVLHFKMET